MQSGLYSSDYAPVNDFVEQEKERLDLHMQWNKLVEWAVPLQIAFINAVPCKGKGRFANKKTAKHRYVWARTFITNWTVFCLLGGVVVNGGYPKLVISHQRSKVIQSTRPSQSAALHLDPTISPIY